MAEITFSFNKRNNENSTENEEERFITYMIWIFTKFGCTSNLNYVILPDISILL